MPSKRYVRRVLDFLNRPEMDALLAGPDVSTWIGRRDYALLLLGLRTGLRASELVSVRCSDIALGTGAHICCEGKGRKQRCTPIRRDCARVLEAWCKERAGDADDPVFPTIRAEKLSREALERIVHKYAAIAVAKCPSLKGKRVSPHILRHSTAMELLQNGVDRTVIALWLGHESVETTQIYVHADLRLKEKALARVNPSQSKPGRFRPADELLTFLESL
ncbi:MAG TPA: tyrosine-type recombinase/integrase [Bryobacteraceae bacterium]|nr:tyrosine-type recombinase/integrase [Bryobacteraceae bacterium]